MKKSLLLLASMMLAVVGMYAQPTKPTVTYTNFADAVLNQSTVYLYNVKAGLFLTGGNNWGTRACAVQNGAKGSNNNASVDDLYLGKAKVSGYKWEVQEQGKETVDGVEHDSYSIANMTGSNYLTADAADGIWVDGGTDRPYNKWYFTMLEGNTFEMQYVGIAGKFGLTSFDSGNTNTFFSEEGGYTTWALVSEEVYENVVDKLNIYYVATKLYNLIESAKAQGMTTGLEEYEALIADEGTAYEEYVEAIEKINPRIALGVAIKEAKDLDANYDFSAYEAVYNGAESTVEQYNEATTKVKAIMAFKKVLDEAAAQDASQDYSAYVALYNNLEATLDTLTAETAHINAFIELKKALDEAKEENPNCDFSTVEAVYSNTASTKEEVENAKGKILSIIADYKAADASAENPLDVTNYIENSTFDKIGDFQGWSGDSFGAGGTTSTCAELYDKDSFNTYQDVNSGAAVPNGIYKLSMVGFYRAGSISNDWNTQNDPAYRHAKLYAKSGEDSLYVSFPSLSAWKSETMTVGSTTGDNGEYRVPNTMADFTSFKDAGFGQTVSVFIPVEDGKLRIGVAKTEHIGTDWAIVDDFTLTFYGKGEDAYQLWLKESADPIVAEVNAAIENATYYYKAGVEDFNNFVENTPAATEKEAVKNYIKGLTEMAEKATSSIAAYKAFFDRLEEIRTYMAEHDDLVGDDVDVLNDYIMEGETADQILDEGELDTEGITNALADLNEKFENAIKNGMGEGTDVSNLLVNPSFKDGFKGWTNAAGVAGGTRDFPIVECYQDHGKVDCYQEVEGVPEGLYAITVQAFERPGGNTQFTGDEETFCYVYMNDFESPVMHIIEDAMPNDAAVDKQNCYITETGGAWPYDYMVDAKGWIPNSVDGGSYAFQGDSYYFPGEKRYTNKTYGLVGSDGKLKIGITSHGKQQHWVLWANFRLIYMAKNAEALSSVIEKLSGDLAAYLENHADEMNAKGQGDATTAVESAEEAIGSDDSDYLWKILNDLNAASNAAKANVEAYAAYLAASDALDVAVEKYQETASDEALTALGDVQDKRQEDMIAEMSNEDINALIEEMNAVITALAIPANYKDATVENPVDVSGVIVNATFDTIGDFTGWEGSSFGAGGTTSTCAERYNMNYDTYQDIKGLPAGTYLVSVQGFYRQGSHTNDYNAVVVDNKPAYNASLYAIAGEDTCTAPIMSISAGRVTEAIGSGSTVAVGEHEVVPNSMAAANDWFEAGYYAPQAEFNQTFINVGEEGKLRIGVKKSVQLSTDWSIFDNFQLWYFGTEVSAEDLATEVEAVDAATAAPQIEAIYTAAGVPVSSFVQGMNIVKYANGVVKKIFVK